MASDPTIPAQPALGAGKNIYVSNAGNDSNDGLTTGTPKLTAAGGMAIKTADTGDHILFNKGDTFTWEGLTITSGGASSSDPLVFGAYGTGDDPIFNAGQVVFDLNSMPINYVTFYGLAMTASGWVKALGYGDSLKFINCHFYECDNNPFNIQGWPTDFWTNVYIGYNRWNGVRRVASGHKAGTYMKNIIGLVNEYNIFNECGWNGEGLPDGPGDATIHNHSTYLVDVQQEISRHNIYCRSSSMGYKMSCTVNQPQAGNYRNLQDCLFIQNGIGVGPGHPGTGAPAYAHKNINITGNVFEYCYRTSVSHTGILTGKIDGMLIEDNCFIHRTPAGNPCIRDPEASTDRRNITIQNNAKWNWNAGGGFTNFTNDATQNIVVQNNRIEGDAGDYVDPTRTVATFDSNEGGPGTVDNFITQALARTTNYSAPVAVDWIKSGYASSTANPSPASISSDRPMALAFAGRGVGIASPIVSGT